MSDAATELLVYAGSFGTEANAAVERGCPTFDQWWYLRGIWSRRAFGHTGVRGPLGPLRHLLKETQEAIDCIPVADTAAGQRVAGGVDDPLVDAGTRAAFLEELVDCLFLVTDAADRAGFGPGEFMRAAAAKLVKNRARTWSPPSVDMPVEHVRTGERHGAESQPG